MSSINSRTYFGSCGAHNLPTTLKAAGCDIWGVGASWQKIARGPCTSTRTLQSTRRWGMYDMYMNKYMYIYTYTYICICTHIYTWFLYYRNGKNGVGNGIGCYSMLSTWTFRGMVYTPEAPDPFITHEYRLKENVRSG